jgi:putative endopeptidase
MVMARHQPLATKLPTALMTRAASTMKRATLKHGGRQDSTKFAQRAKMLADQFSGYNVYGQHINGKATLGENIADLGGIVIGLDAFKKTDQYKEGKTINGLTPVQRYFMGYALGWLGQDRKESLSSQMLNQ